MNKKKYMLFYNSLTEKEKESLDTFFIELKKKINISKKQNNLLFHDFEKAFIKYYDLGLDVYESMELLDLKNLGGYYKGDTKRWYPLDYAAKIYPMSMKNNRMAVFRISMYLKKDIIPEILQMALLFTIKRFPYFSTSIRKGFFWHYMDSVKRRYQVYPEKDCACSTIKISSTLKPSFRVVYYKNRISVEFFHILTDGTGGTIFIKTLVAEYLRLLGINIPNEESVLNVNGKPSIEEWSNDFKKAEKSDKASGFKDKKAVQLDGKLSSVRPCQVLHFDFNSEEILAYSKEKGYSITVVFLAFIFTACSYSVSSNKDIKIQVPVNMRRHYESRTLRNFSLYVVVSINKKDVNDFDKLLENINNQLKEKTTKEKLNETMIMTNKLVEGIKYIPLNIKKPIAEIVYGFLGEKVFTSVLSNIGVVKLPEEMYKHIEKMDLVLGTSSTNRALFSLISCNNVTTLSMTKLTLNASVENNMHNLFVKNKLNVKVYGSDIYGTDK